MDEQVVRGRFDGRGRVEVVLRSGRGDERERAERIAHAMGYRLSEVQGLGRLGIRLDFTRDDDPRARRRAEESVRRLRAGVPLLSAPDAPPPPPPGPPPAAAPAPRPRPRAVIPDEPPPPPAAVRPPAPRVPPRPAYPPPPPPPPRTVRRGAGP
ncbi:hypothetical protein ACFW9D_07670 [Streptomyces sp. NPDC059524]|uniref:hypothetical protein n=1 Tax=Streptomyces sp. NPDC059524 TaxID=3346856 RepID=UPI0036C84EBE